MKYLLDVNALLAWRHPGSTDHAAFHAWAAQEKFGALATCAHSELGFLRASIQAFGYSAEAAGKALAEIKREVGGFVSASPSPKLPPWCRKGAQTSDVYLAQIAASAGLTLATFDTGIPGAPHRLIRPPAPAPVRLPSDENPDCQGGLDSGGGIS